VKLSRAVYSSRLRHGLLLVGSVAEFAVSEKHVEEWHRCGRWDMHIKVDESC
jgi:hypothetical protein